MTITIAERLKPFSHIPGTTCLIPGMHVSVQIFPALIIVSDLSKSSSQELFRSEINIHGPVNDFTVCQDLEANCIRIWGHSANGFFRYNIFNFQDQKVSIEIEKEPKNGLKFSNAQKINFGKKISVAKISERLSLGNNKSQDWDLVSRRLDMKEIFPAWYLLGQSIEIANTNDFSGTAALLKQIEEKIKSKSINEIVPLFQNLFLTGFSGILVPSLIDKNYQGFSFPEVAPNANATPLKLLQMGASLIRSLFIQHSDDQVFILPALPPQFHCGRLIQTQINNIGLFDLEWSKKLLRRMVIHSKVNKIIMLHFQSDLKKYRLNGQYCDISQPLTIEADTRYIFDNFQK